MKQCLGRHLGVVAPSWRLAQHCRFCSIHKTQVQHTLTFVLVEPFWPKAVGDDVLLVRARPQGVRCRSKGREVYAAIALALGRHAKSRLMDKWKDLWRGEVENDLPSVGQTHCADERHLVCELQPGCRNDSPRVVNRGGRERQTTPKKAAKRTASAASLFATHPRVRARARGKAIREGVIAHWAWHKAACRVCGLFAAPLGQLVGTHNLLGRQKDPPLVPRLWVEQ
mmetsp:Transcript_42011/g.77811  ORF Transcript_42011/g.77811 Transcript_42011/m.77811 type:complete len:226 (-) Transcript_42011:173-850(-)